MAEQIKRNNSFGFKVYVFTKEESLFQFLKDNKTEMLLYENNSLNIEKMRPYCNFCCILSQDKILVENSAEEIYKYQSVKKVTDDIIKLYKRQNICVHESIRDNQTKIQIYGIFSIEQVSARTAYAINFTRKESKSLPTLYLNFDLFSDAGIQLGYTGKDGMTELLYYIRQKDKNFMERFDEIIIREGEAHFLLPFRHYRDFYDLRRKDIEFLFEQLSEQRYYKKLIIEFGMFQEITTYIWSCCDNIILLSEKNNIRNQLLLQELEEEMGSDQILKIKQINISEENDIKTLEGGTVWNRKKN